MLPTQSIDGDEMDYFWYRLQLSRDVWLFRFGVYMPLSADSIKRILLARDSTGVFLDGIPQLTISLLEGMKFH